jgi:uncharacterized protein YndB with AHSA1/START domain
MSDYGVVTAPNTVRLERVLPGPIERVWSYLTDSDKRAEWLAAGLLEPRVGGALELRFNHAALTPHREEIPEPYRKYDGSIAFNSTVLRFEPPRVLSISWPQSAADDSAVTFELTPQGKDVLLVITHTRLANRDELLSVSGGWHAHVGILVDKLNGRVPKGFWAEHARLEKEYAARIPR